jgi:prepilin-type N-terminal cleavage/methylation domain-containing protein
MTFKQFNHQPKLARQSGFSLIEISVVLVIIGIIIGAVTIGRDVQRTAAYQRIATEFVQGWAIGYDTFAANNGIVIADNATNPTGYVNAATATPLCLNNLRTAMQAAGVRMPSGRAEGSETLAVYLDSSGTPQEMAICFSNVAWSEPAATPGTFVVRNRNVMAITGMSPSMAKMLDNHFDGRVDARFGKFREQAVANNTAAASIAWTQNESALDEAQSAVMNGYLLMNQ